MKKRQIKEVLYFFVVVVVFAVFTSWKFGDVLNNNVATIAPEGDGRGFQAGIYIIHEQVKNEGWTSLYGDLFKVKGVGPKTVQPEQIPINSFWKYLSASIASFVREDKAYDYIGALSMILIGISGYLLGRALLINHVLSVMIGFLLVNMDHFNVRAQSHLPGLGFYFLLILLTAFTVTLKDKKTFPRMFFWGFLFALNFQVNEYNGYYGLIFCSILFLSMNFKFIIENIKTYRLYLLGASTVATFLVSMCFLYPTLFGSRLMPFIFHNNTGLAIGNFSRDASDFSVYNAGNFMYLLRPSSLFNIPFFSKHFFDPKNHENTFRLGIFVFITIVFSIAYLISQKKWQNIFKMITFFLVPSIVLVLLAAPSQFPLSLVGVTKKFAPMFRVGVRSLIFFDIVVFIFFAYAIQEVFNSLIKDKLKIQYKVVVGVIVVVLGFVSVVDVTNASIFHKISMARLPNTYGYDILANKPDGYLVEFPLFHEKGYNCNSLYYYNRIFHKKPVINLYSFPKKDEFSFLPKMGEFKDEDMLKLKAIGVKYIVANKDFTALSKYVDPESDKINYKELAAKKYLTKILVSDSRDIYAFN